MAHKYTRKTFIKKLKELKGDSVGYVKRFKEYYQKELITLRCPTHGNFKENPFHAIHGKINRCCVVRKRKPGLTHEEYIAHLKTVRGGAVKVLEPYVGYRTAIKHLCPIHGEFEAKPSILMGNNWKSACCSKRGNWRKDLTRFFGTETEYKKHLKKKYEGKITLVGEYLPKKQMLHSCSIHGEFLARQVILANKGFGTECGCFKPKLGLQAKTIVCTEKAYDKMLKERSSGRVKRIDPYVDLNTRILHYCKLHDLYFHNSHYNTRLKDICGCPECGFDNTIRGRYTLSDVEFGDCTFRVQGYEPHALRYLIEKRGIEPVDILAGLGSKIPTIRYVYGKIHRNYHPDIFIPKKNKLIEVKSLWTLLQRKSIFYTNAEKARVCIEQGYKFQLLVFNQDGTHVKVPKDWYDMKYSKMCAHFGFTPCSN
jgi:hypothetical protein